MVSFVIRVAEQIIGISAQHTSTEEYCKDYVTVEQPNYYIEIKEDDISYEWEKYRLETAGVKRTIQSATNLQLELTAIQRKLNEMMYSADVLLFHGSVVAIDGNAYLFTAKSGTGKSTHTRLWREVFGDRAVMVNDDKPFLQLTENGVIAWGSPWNGKHRLGSNIGVPLKAICILERSNENWIKSINPAQALPMLFQQSQRPRNPANMPKYMELVDKLANSVEFYRMGCNMDPEAALVSYEAMSRGRKEEKT